MKNEQKYIPDTKPQQNTTNLNYVRHHLGVQYIMKCDQSPIFYEHVLHVHWCIYNAMQLIIHALNTLTYHGPLIHL